MVATPQIKDPIVIPTIGEPDYVITDRELANQAHANWVHNCQVDNLSGDYDHPFHAKLIEVEGGWKLNIYETEDGKEYFVFNVPRDLAKCIFPMETV